MSRRFTHFLAVILCLSAMAPATSGASLCIVETLTGIAAHHHMESINPGAVCHQDDVDHHDHEPDHSEDDHPPCEEDCFRGQPVAGQRVLVENIRTDRIDSLCYTVNYTRSWEDTHQAFQKATNTRVPPPRLTSVFLCRFLL